MALITARGKSKGIPGKNIIDLGGRPLLAWTIEAALESKYIDRLILSTDDHSIAEVARHYNCEVPFMRPHELALDDTPSMSVIMHALEMIDEKYDYLLLLQPTSPFRKHFHIDFAVEFLFDRKSLSVVSVSKVKKHPALLYYKMQDGSMQPVLKGPQGERRQDFSPVYEYNGAIYFSEINYLMQSKSYKTKDVVGVELPDYVNLDMDDMDDLVFARYIVETGRI